MVNRAGRVIGDRDSDDAGDEIVEALLRALGARDPATLEHARRVGSLAVVLAQRVGVGPAEVSNVRKGALLHDVGKIGVPDRILFKPARLTPEESRVVQEHTSIGYQIIAPIPRLRVAAEIVLHHHERFDGGGYPSGSKGDDIPFGARLVAIVDAFDALTHARPYRQALPVDVALAEIRDASGAKYDPWLAGAFLELARRGALPPE